MPSAFLHENIRGIASAIALASDESNVITQLDDGLQGVENQLSALNTAHAAFNQALAASVQTQIDSTESLKQFLAQQTEVLIRVASGTPESIDLEDADDDCIQQAFTFMRTLNEIESLVTDSEFTATTEKGRGKRNKVSNNDTLKKYRSPQNSLYSRCIAILEEQLGKGDLTDNEHAQFKAEFEFLFEDVAAELGDRAERLVAIHEFRDRILHFFAERRTDEPPAAASNEPVTSQISLVQGDATNS